MQPHRVAASFPTTIRLTSISTESKHWVRNSKSDLFLKDQYSVQYIQIVLKILHTHACAARTLFSIQMTILWWLILHTLLSRSWSSYYFRMHLWGQVILASEAVDSGRMPFLVRMDINQSLEAPKTWSRKRKNSSVKAFFPSCSPVWAGIWHLSHLLQTPWTLVTRPSDHDGIIQLAFLGLLPVDRRRSQGTPTSSHPP